MSHYLETEITIKGETIPVTLRFDIEGGDTSVGVYGPYIDYWEIAEAPKGRDITALHHAVEDEGLTPAVEDKIHRWLNDHWGEP